MSFQAWIILALTSIAAVCLIFEVLRPDLVAILVLVSIGIFQLIPLNEVFSGFSSSVVITLIGIYILSAALHDTGAAFWLGSQLFRFSGNSSPKLILATLLTAACLSLFMNNVAVIGLLLPAVTTLAGKANVPIRRLLFPLAYGTMLGGMATLLTTPNLIVSSALGQAGYTPYSISDFFPIGFPIIGLGLVYLLLIDWFNRRKFIDGLPINREPSYIQRLLLQYQATDQFYLLRLPVSPSLTAVEQEFNLSDSPLPITPLAILRNRRLLPLQGEEVSGRLPEDQLLVMAGNDPTRLIDTADLTLEPIDLQECVNGVISLHEVRVPAASSSNPAPCTQSIPAFQNHQIIPLAVRRQGIVLTEQIQQITFLEGDTLLCFGDFAGLLALQHQTGWHLDQMDPNTIQRPKKWLLAFLITALTLLLAVFEVFPIHLAILSGALLVILTGCIDQKKIYQVIDWRTVFLIAGLWPLGLAIKQSGLAENLIQSIHLTQFANTPWIIGAVILSLSMGFTQIIGAQVSGIITIPIAISIAQATHLDARSLGMAAALGCSFVFLLPFSHPVNLMITRAGNINSKDFFKLGFPFFILLFLVVLTGLHLFWGL